MPSSDQALHKSLKIVYILANRTGPDEEPRDIAISTYKQYRTLFLKLLVVSGIQGK